MYSLYLHYCGNRSAAVDRSVTEPTIIFLTSLFGIWSYLSDHSSRSEKRDDLNRPKMYVFRPRIYTYTGGQRGVVGWGMLGDIANLRMLGTVVGRAVPTGDRKGRVQRAAQRCFLYDRNTFLRANHFFLKDMLFFCFCFRANGVDLQ